MKVFSMLGKNHNQVDADACDIITPKYRISIRLNGVSVYTKDNPDEPMIRYDLDLTNDKGKEKKK